MSKKISSRRRFLQGAAGVGVAGIAGCLGGDGDDGGNGDGGDNGDDGGDNGDGGENGDDGNGDGDTVNMRVGSSTQGSTVFQTSQALQRVLSEQSDSVRWDTQTTGGDPASIRIYDEGNLEAYGLTNYIVKQAMEGSEPFEEGEIENFPYQGFSYFVRDDFFWAVDGSGIETTDDMLGSNFHMLQPGWGTRQMFVEIMETGGGEDLLAQLEENVVNIDVADVAGAVEEGRVECGIGYGANEVNLPSWLAEVDARADVHLVEMTDQFRAVFEESPLAPYYEKEPYGWDQDVTQVTDTLQGWQLLFQYFFSPDLSAESVYEVLQISHDHWESVREGQPAFFPYGENPEHFITAIEEDFVPVHPGAADFYEENDLWDDSWERGD